MYLIAIVAILLVNFPLDAGGMEMTDPNIQSLVAFGIVAGLILLGLAAKIMLGRSKTAKRTSTAVDLFP